jgi:hypothetical protein
MHATIRGASLFLLADVIHAEPGERPSEPLADHDGAQILTRSEQGQPVETPHLDQGMLRALPFQTIGDIARHGLELHVYCSRCFATRRFDLERNTALDGRAFATTRFRCRRCGTPGVPKIRPFELLPVGGPVTLAFLWCNSCIWEIDQAQLDKPPWRGSAQHYRCPGCGGRVEWHIHGRHGVHLTTATGMACPR